MTSGFPLEEANNVDVFLCHDAIMLFLEYPDKTSGVWHQYISPLFLLLISRELAAI